MTAPCVCHMICTWVRDDISAGNFFLNSLGDIFEENIGYIPQDHLLATFLNKPRLIPGRKERMSLHCHAFPCSFHSI